MSGKARQRGITLISFVIVLAVVGFFAFIIMRLFPVYSEYYSVVQAMRSLQQEPGVSNWDAPKIRESLRRRFKIGYVDVVKPDDIKLIRTSGGKQLQVKYEVRRPFAYNLDFVAKFENTVELSPNAGD